MARASAGVTSSKRGKLTFCSRRFALWGTRGDSSGTEISTVGKNEEELTQDGIPYEIGKANYKEIARGQIIGDTTGLLKLIFHNETRELLGVHIIGEDAAELIHIGQAVMAHKGTVDYFVNTVFNYPTLAECYKTAAFDGVNRLG